MVNGRYSVGVIGCGVIGGALIKWLEEYNKNVDILRVDPPKGMNDDISKADIVFVSIHIPTENDGTQNLSVLEEIIVNCPDVPIYIRTTLLPGTCDALSEKTGKQVYFMPEFLTERTAVNDFHNQPMIFTGDVELLEKIFVNKPHIKMTSLEAEITKYAHNVFGALKVTYFNGIYDYCKRNGADYNKVQQGVLLSGYINRTHSDVPGPDGKLGYGGKCFPKDVNAFKEVLKGYALYDLIAPMPKMNEQFRNTVTEKEILHA